jgi:hypothetical protein
VIASAEETQLHFLFEAERQPVMEQNSHDQLCQLKQNVVSSGMQLQGLLNREEP